VKNPPKLEAQLDEGEKVATLWIYGDIGTEVTSDQVVKMIESIPKSKPIIVRINSLGGFAHDGLAIYSALKQRGNTITRVDGIAASAASIIAMAGNPVQVFPHSQIFIHRAIINVFGNIKALKYAMEWLEKIDHSIATVYASKTRKSPKRIMDYMDGEFDGTIFSAEESLKLGFADVILSEDSNTNAINLSTDKEEKESPVTVKDKPNLPKNFVPSNPEGGDGEGVEGDWEAPNLEDKDRIEAHLREHLPKEEEEASKKLENELEFLLELFSFLTVV